MAGSFYVGTSGWSYPNWRDTFYRGVPRRRWLAHCADHFTAVEVNATFYGRQRPETLARWAAETPPAFRFAIKANRYLTHVRRLAGIEAGVAAERDHAAPLGEKLAAVLWQLPASLHRDDDRLLALCRALAAWPAVRHAVEMRHRSWFCDPVARLLADHRVAVCQSDAGGWPLWEAVTTDLVYLRLHGRPRTYRDSYSEEALAAWAARIRGWLAEGRDVHCYFDNDAEGAAPANALRLMELVSGRG